MLEGETLFSRPSRSHINKHQVPLTKYGAGFGLKNGPPVTTGCWKEPAEGTAPPPSTQSHNPLRSHRADSLDLQLSKCIVSGDVFSQVSRAPLALAARWPYRRAHGNGRMRRVLSDLEHSQRVSERT